MVQDQAYRRDCCSSLLGCSVQNSSFRPDPLPQPMHSPGITLFWPPAWQAAAGVRATGWGGEYNGKGAGVTSCGSVRRTHAGRKPDRHSPAPAADLAARPRAAFGAVTQMHSPCGGAGTCRAHTHRSCRRTHSAPGPGPRRTRRRRRWWTQPRRWRRRRPARGWPWMARPWRRRARRRRGRGAPGVERDGGNRSPRGGCAGGWGVGDWARAASAAQFSPAIAHY
jgi:hypothetical protein